MKSCFLLLALSVVIFSSRAFSQNSENGYWSPVSGELRVLLVFAELTTDAAYNDEDPNWPKGQMPVNPGKYFDAVFSSGNETGYLTKYFSQASFTHFQMTGDYVPTLVQVAIPGINAVFAELNNLPGNDLITQHNLSLNAHDFDKWSGYINGSYGIAKTASANDRLDIICVLWRVNSFVGSTDGSGYCASAIISGTIKNMTGADCYSEFRSLGNNAEIIMRHEIGHSLYGANNFHTAGCGAGHRNFMSSMGGFSGMSSWDNCSSGWNAFDRYRLGWKPATKQFQISAFDVVTGNEVDFEGYSQANNSAGGE